MRNILGIALVLFTALLVAPLRADDATSDKERIAQLEKQLKEAQEQIESLKAEIEKLSKPEKSKTTAAKKKDATDDFFPRGAKFSGTAPNGDFACTGTVLSRSPGNITLRVDNSNGVRDWVIRLKGTKAVLVGTSVVSVKGGGPPTKMTNINVSGTIDEKTIRLSGEWRFNNANASKVSQVALNVSLD